MQLAIEKTSEKVKTWLFKGLAVENCFVDEQFSVEDFVKLYRLVDVVAIQTISIGTHNRDHLKQVGVFVFGKQLPCLAKEFASHQVVLPIHIKNSLAKVFVIL